MVDAGDVRTALLDVLRARSGKALFAPEMHASLGRLNVATADIERALSQLEAEGAVVVRDHYCADPHVAGADLRIVALVEEGEGGDAQERALHGIEQTWRQWLGEFFANHRCT